MIMQIKLLLFAADRRLFKLWLAIGDNIPDFRIPCFVGFLS